MNIRKILLAIFTLFIIFTSTACSKTKTSNKEELFEVGGIIFYDAGDNGATYTFYDKDKNVLDDAYVGTEYEKAPVYYSVKGKYSDARYYVVATDKDGNLVFGENLEWGAQDTQTSTDDHDRTKSGKFNTLQALENPNSFIDCWGNDDTIWTWINTQNLNCLNGHSDWYIHHLKNCLH